jgi:hypothetical protein
VGPPCFRPRRRRHLLRKAAALPDPAPDLTVAVCAREQVTDLPEGVLAITAEDIFDH